MTTDTPQTTRIDRWLWAVRFYKTRSLAAQAVSAGHALLNGQRCKPAKNIAIGDILQLRRPGFMSCTVAVTAIIDKRVAAKIAIQCYKETPESIAKREKETEQRRLWRDIDRGLAGDGRPDKQQRRQILALHRGRQKGSGAEDSKS